MSCNDDGGAGQNIDFYLITTGLDINPANGTVAKTNYEYLKTVFSSTADIMYEIPSLREITDVNFSMYLDAYDHNPRNLYQALFGVARYNNPWSNQLLEDSINQGAIFPKLKPNDGEFSINPYELYDKSFGLYKCVQSSPGNLSWAEMGSFKITEDMPGLNDGLDKSVWGVTGDGSIKIYVKSAFSWILLDEYVAGQNASLVISKTSPTMVLGKYWLRISDTNVYEYSDNSWGSAQLATFQQSLTGASSDNDKIILYRDSSLVLYNYFESKYKKQRLSQYVIRDSELNSIFKNSTTENFIVEDGCIALLGGIVSHLFDGDESMVRVFQDGIYFGDYSGIDFKNVTVHESLSLNNTVEIIHQHNGGEGLSLQLTELVVENENQTVFSVPNNMLEFVDLTVNGISNYSVTFDINSYTIAFDPLAAGYELDPNDSLVLSYLY